MVDEQVTTSPAPDEPQVVRIVGDLDLASLPGLRRTLEELLASGVASIVLDLSRVDYADSSALGLLVWLNGELAPRRGRVVLAGASRDVIRVLELSGLLAVANAISSSANVDAALEGLGLAAVPAEPLWTRDVAVVPALDRLANARDEVCELVAPLGFPESALFDLKVAVGEAFANAVAHGLPPAGELRVGASVTAFPDRVIITVDDNGVGFSGEPSQAGDLYASGGRGVEFMRALVDRVEFSASPWGGTRVSLTKHRVQWVGENDR